MLLKTLSIYKELSLGVAFVRIRQHPVNLFPIVHTTTLLQTHESEMTRLFME